MQAGNLAKSALNYAHGIYHLRYTAVLCVKNHATLFTASTEAGSVHWAFLKEFLTQYGRDFNQSYLIHEFLQKKTPEDRADFQKIRKDIPDAQFITEHISVAKEYLTIIALTPHDFYLELTFLAKPNLSAVWLIDQIKTESSRIFKLRFPNDIGEALWESDALIFTTEMNGQQNFKDFMTALNGNSQRGLDYSLPLAGHRDADLYKFGTQTGYYALRYLAVLVFKNFQPFVSNPDKATAISHAIQAFFHVSATDPQGLKRGYKLLSFDLKNYYIAIDFKIHYTTKPSQFINSVRMALTKRIKHQFAHESLAELWELPYFLITLDASMKDQVADYIHYKQVIYWPS